MTEGIQAQASESGPSEVSLDDALEIAVRAHQMGDVEVAEKVYGRILDAAPDFAPALHFSGILHHQTNRSWDGVRLIRRAIEIEPDDSGMHSNLGNIFVELDRPDIAVPAFETAILLDVDNIDARNNLGVALRQLRRVTEAEAVYREAIELDPEHREAWDNLGRLLMGLGRFKEAIDCHLKALELEPQNASTRRFLIGAYAAFNKNDRAIEILRDWLKREPDSPSANHLMASIAGENVPERASDRYVEELFDGFSASFDRKLAMLDYRAPQIVSDAVAAACPGASESLSILDAGCGTGLCGPLVRPLAREVVGVDLSGKMLEQAKRRGCYDALEQAELGRYLADHPASYDVVLSADTFCYFGTLDTAFAAAHASLRPGGAFVFSVEDGEGEAFTLHSHGRYSHARSYVERALVEAGFGIEAIQRDTLRMERGDPVFGLVVTARRA